MPTLDALDALFKKGHYSDIINLTTSEGALGGGDPQRRVIVAHALALTGALSEAETLLGDVEMSRAAKWIGRSEQVLGLCCQARGDVGGAVQHFNAAIRRANEIGDKELKAWSHLGLFRLQMHMESAETLAAMLRDVRRSVTDAGDTHITAYLQLCVSALEGQAGRLGEAWRHCDIAEGLLANTPNAWLSAIVLQNRVCVAALMCDFRTALTLLGAGRQMAERSGDIRAIGGCAINAGHIHTLTGSFDAARRSYGRILNSNEMGRVARLGALDGMARLELTLGNFDACDQMLQQIESLTSLRINFNARWSSISHARLLIRRGQFAEALDYCSRAQAELGLAKDIFLTSALDLTIAQAYSALGKFANAALHVLAAGENSGATDFTEWRGQYYYALADVLDRSGQRGLAQQNRSRALRMWKHHGVVSAKLEMGSSELSQRDEAVPRRSSDVGGKLANSFAAAFDLAYSPKLLGLELIDALAALEYTDIRLATSSKGTAHDKSSGETAFVLGEEGRKELQLVYRIPETPRAAVAVSTVLKIGRAAISLEKHRQEERNRAALWPADPIETEAGALFVDKEMQNLLGVARRIAPANVPVLITGETGTGKEVLAKLIHAYSNRARATFLPFNCSASPKDMLDAQLFGHRRGAFTGAVDSFQGVIRGAAGGTLFLDEIGETTLDVQPKLLRFLESSEVHPIGETQPVRVDVRVIAATNADIDGLVSQGRFREDLFYRLNIVRLHVPPLRERRVEIPALANHYLAKAAQENAKGDLRLAEETMEYLVLYRWPGNVRQLANEMRRMAVLAEAGAVLMPEHLSGEIAASRKTIPASERVLEPTEIVVRLDQPMSAAVQHVEQAQIQWAMKKSGGGLEETAALLGISRKGLYLKRQRFGIDPPEAAPEFEVA